MRIQVKHKKKYTWLFLSGGILLLCCMMNTVHADPEPYIQVVPPMQSFGSKTPVIMVNTSYFWSLIDNNTQYILEGLHPVNGWVYTNESLAIERNRHPSYEKITFNFTSPYTTRYRITYAFKLDAIDYVNKSTYEIGMNLSIPGTDLYYPVVYNWSDVKPMIQNGDVIQKHGLTNVNGERWLWFRLITVNNIPAGNTVLIDPYFGYKAGTVSTISISDEIGDEDIRGLRIQPTSSETLKNITCYLRNTNTNENLNVTCYLYSWDAGNSEWNIQSVTTNITLPNSEASGTWRTFDFASDQLVTSGNYYVLAVYAESASSGMGGVGVGYSSTGGNTTYHSDLDNYPNHPDPWTPTSTDTSSEMMIYAYYSTNQSPVLSSPSPSDGATTPSSTSELSVTINDPEGDTFNWTIETSPDVGDSSANDASNGSKTCSVTGLVNGTMYTWYVNVTDGINTVSQTYTFYVYGTIEFWCYDESNPSTTIPFGIEISNSDGTSTYQNTSLTSGDTISIEDMPGGDNIIFIVNSTGYETRTYTYDVEAKTLYNYSFYLPPESDYDILKSNSTAVTDHTSDTSITLECEPRMVVFVQGYNTSIYGGWFSIAEGNYTLSGSTITVSSDVLDANTSLVQAQYYCDDKVLDYIIHVVDEVTSPIKNARISISFMHGGVFHSVSSVLTDGNGDATVFLIPGQHYKIKINKSGYENETADFVPTENVRTKTYQLSLLGVDIIDEYDFHEEITFNASMAATGVITIVFDDALTSTNYANVTVYENNTNTGVYWYNTSATHSFTVDTAALNTSLSYQAYLQLDHSIFGVVTLLVIVPGYNMSYRDITNKSDFDTYFDIFGDNPFQWHNFIGFLVLISCIFTFGKRNTGLAVMLSGGVFLFLEYIVGLSLLGSTLGILLLVIGGLTQYRNIRSEVRY